MWWNKKQDKRRKNSKTIWNGSTPPPKPKQPAKYVPSGEVIAPIVSSFEVGRAIITKVPFVPVPFKEIGVYPFPVLMVAKNAPESEVTEVPAGSLLVYTGQIRTIERTKVDGHNREFSVLKHTFVTPIGRCIIHDRDFEMLVSCE